MPELERTAAKKKGKKKSKWNKWEAIFNWIGLQKNKTGICDIITACCGINIGNASTIWHLNKDIGRRKNGDISEDWTMWLGSVRVV